MLVVFIRTIILYIVIIFGLRTMGKRQIGELQPSELVITIMISNIATLPIEDTNIPTLSGIVPILALVCFEVIVSEISLHSLPFRYFVWGKPRIIIRDGKLDQKLLRRLRLSIDDLMKSLRSCNIFDIRDVSYAIIENTGKISVYQKFEAQTPSNALLKIPTQKNKNTPPTAMIIDGEVIKESFDYCNLSPKWLDKVLKEKNISISQVFLMTCDSSADYHIVLKENYS